MCGINSQWSNMFGRAHKLQKRTIVRGLYLPDLNGSEKERPALVLNDVGNTMNKEVMVGAGIRLVPIKSRPYNHFDIPFIYSPEYHLSTVSFISVMNEFNLIMTDLEKKSSNSCVILPDDAFDLVIKVKKLINEDTKESIQEAIGLIKEWRLNLMNEYNIHSIQYPVSTQEGYILYKDGTEEYIKIKGMDFERLVVLDGNKTPTIGDDFKDVLNMCVENSEIPEGIYEVKAKRERINFKKCTDSELIQFMKVLENYKDRTAIEMSKVLSISPATVPTRYKAISKELDFRGLGDYVIPYPFARNL